MIKTENDNKTCCFLIFEIIVGSMLIHFPSGKNGTEMIVATLLATAFAVPFCLLLYKKTSVVRPAKPQYKMPYKILAGVLCLYLVYACGKNYVGFCDDLMLPFTPSAVLCAAVLVSAFLVGLLKPSALLKLAAVLGVVCVAFYILLFAGLLSSAVISVDFKNFDIKTVLFETVKVFARSFGTLCVLPIIMRGKTVGKKGISLGLIMGAGVLVGAVSLVHFSLGEVVGNLSVPLYTACGTIQIGEDFARVDFLCFFNLFVTAFIKLSALFFAAKVVIYSLKIKKPKAWYAVFCALAALLTLENGILSFLDSLLAAAIVLVLETAVLVFYE